MFYNNLTVAKLIDKKYLISAKYTNSKCEGHRLPLHNFHINCGAKMHAYAGWQMPMIYATDSIITSHLHTRTAASLFDVSHMVQTRYSYHIKKNLVV
jgi:aminomethyltransferase